jgi:hypothetical protein
MEDGSIKLLKRKPDDNQRSHMHGFMLLKPTLGSRNAKLLMRAAEYCDKGFDYKL